VLSAFSKFTDTSPTQRGILVRSRLLCSTIDPPPATVNADEPPPPTPEANCKIDRYRAHTQSASCNDCHSLIDPIGFGLENYDIAGRFRAFTDDDPACVVDRATAQGELPGLGSFFGPKELAHTLVDDGVLADCLMQQLHSYREGRPLLDDKPTVDAWHQRFLDNGRDLQGLMIEQVSGAQFVHKREPEVP
jgi:hypothetical protein